MKGIVFTVGVKTKDGKKYVAQGNKEDWKVARNFIGVGMMDSF